jgi:hypothetical protein
MKTNPAAHTRQTSLAWSAVFRAAGLSIFGLIVWLWLFAAEGLPWSAVSLVAVQALAALAGVVWYLPRARAERRWRAAMDHYGEQELAKQRAGSPANVPPPACPYQVKGRLLTGAVAVICTQAPGSCPLQELRPMTGGRHTAVCRLREGVISGRQLTGRAAETA